jgi:dihydroorotate dehydrogenase electron transfer subunit
VVENVRMAQDTYRLRLDCPDVARRIVPGQFVMLRLPCGDDPLLGRPLALYDTVLDRQGRPCGIDIVYLVVGKLTGRLARLQAGDEVVVWGPLGNGFPPAEGGHLLMVAGGIGQTPFLALAREALGLRAYGDSPRRAMRVQRVTFCYGVRTAALLAGVDDFASLGVEVLTSTDDGTAGHRGLVTQLLDRLLATYEERTAGLPRHSAALRIVCCGPEPMMAAVARRAQQADIPCLVSLETPMACGIGICFSCVARVRQADGGWDYRRTCVEGPVFDAARIVFD